MTDLTVLLLLAATESGSPMSLEEVRFFEQLYYDYADVIQKKIHSSAKCQADAEDLVQHCLLKLAEHVGTLMRLQPYQIAKYISVTIDNILCNYWSKNAAVTFENIDDVQNVLTENRTQYQPEIMVDLRQELELFAAAFDKLTQKEKLLMQYRYIESLDMEEIARRMGIKESGVRQALYRVRRRMLQLMKKGEE